MNIYEYDDYRIFVTTWVKKRPKRGHGEYQKIAEFLRVPPSVFSLIIGGQRELNIEKGYLLSDYLGLKFTEKDYFIYLVDYANASNHKYKTYLKEKIQKLQFDSKNLEMRLEEKKTLDLLDQVEFYSSWLYSAIRLHCSIGTGSTFSEILESFPIKESELNKILTFLIRIRLVELNNGKYVMGLQRLTYVGKDSAMLSKHHSNWRIKSLEKTMHLEDSDYFMTFPLTCSKADVEKIKSKISQLMVDVTEIVKNSDAEEQLYFGIDFFKLYKNIK